MSLPTEITMMMVRTKVKTIQKTILFKILDSELMPDSGPFIKDKLDLMLKNITLSTTQSTLMSLPMVMSMMTVRTKAKTTQRTISFKTPDSDLTLDSGLFTKRRLTHMPKSTINTKTRNTLMNLQMAMLLMIRKTIMRTIQKIIPFKIPVSELMPDFGLLIKENLTHTPKSKFTPRNTLTSLPTETLLMTKKTTTRTIQLTIPFKTQDSDLTPDFGPFIKELLDLSSKPRKLCI